MKTTKPKKLNNKGFTLIELIIYMGLLAIILVVLVDLFVAIVDLRLESRSNSYVFQDGEYMMRRLEYDIKRAQTLVQPAAQSNGENLSLTAEGQTYTYQKSGDSLQVTTAGNSYDLNSSKTVLDNITFERIGSHGNNDTIKVTFQLTSVTEDKQGAESRVFTSTFETR